MTNASVTANVVPTTVTIAVPRVRSCKSGPRPVRCSAANSATAAAAAPALIRIASGCPCGLARAATGSPNCQLGIGRTTQPPFFSPIRAG